MAATGIPQRMLLVSGLKLTYSSSCHFVTVLSILFTDIVFTGDNAVLPDSAIGNNYLTNFNKLTSMGNQLLTDLVDELGL